MFSSAPHFAGEQEDEQLQEEEANLTIYERFCHIDLKQIISDYPASWHYPILSVYNHILSVFEPILVLT